MLAGREHYGSHGTLPMIPGIDGTGRSPDGTRVYFGGVRPPYGPMAQGAAAPFVLPLPDGVDEVTAAAIVNPGNGAWLALTRRAAAARRNCAGAGCHRRVWPYRRGACVADAPAG